MRLEHCLLLARERYVAGKRHVTNAILSVAMAPGLLIDRWLKHLPGHSPVKI